MRVGGNFGSENMEQKSTLWWAGAVTTIGTALVTGGVVISFVWGLATSIMTEDEHETDLQKVQVEIDAKYEKQRASVETIESSVLVPRIRRQMDRRCAEGPLDQDILEMVNRWRARYQEIEGREFPWGRCEEGKWVAR